MTCPRVSELHVNAPQGNVWVNDPLVMSDGTSPVAIEPKHNAHSAAMVFDGHLLDEPVHPASNTSGCLPDERTQSIPASCTAAVDSHAGLPLADPEFLSKSNGTTVSTVGHESQDLLPVLLPDRSASTDLLSKASFTGLTDKLDKEADDLVTSRLSLKNSTSLEDGRHTSQTPRARDLKNVSDRPLASSERHITKEFKLKDQSSPRVPATHSTSADNCSSMTSGLPPNPLTSHGLSTTKPRRQSTTGPPSKNGTNSRPHQHSNGGKGAGAHRGTSWRSSNNAPATNSAMKQRGFSTSERSGHTGRGGGMRTMEDPQSWYPHPPYPYPANPYSNQYAMPNGGHHATITYGTSSYPTHPESPIPNSTPPVTSSHVTMGAMGPLYPASHVSQLPSPAPFYPPISHPFSTSLPPHAVVPQGDQAFQDPSTYYGMHHYYPPPQSPSLKSSRATSIIMSGMSSISLFP